MKKALALFILVVYIVTAQIQVLAESPGTNTEPVFLTEEKINKVEKYVTEQMKKGKIPGLSVVLLEGDKTVYKKSFGYADVEAKKPVTSDTVFELGSMTKAFTGLGLLYLQNKGLLNLDDPVEKYLPWFWMHYKGKKVSITLAQFLHQTGGVPGDFTGRIPVSDDAENGIENTVRMLVGEELDSYPGEEPIYSTINYDVLGLVIQKVSGMTYEQFMRNNIFPMLGLKSTFIAREDVDNGRMAQGYKIGFNKPLKYNPPPFRGNTPAGYVLSSINDMEEWLRIQLGIGKQSDEVRKLIEESHIPDRTVNPFPSYDTVYGSYCAGWDLCQSGDGGQFYHAGVNPTFSSCISFRMDEKLGVAVLANMNSGYIYAIAPFIINILRDKRVPESRDTALSTDRACFTVLCITAPFSLLVLIMILYMVIEILRRKRTFSGINIKKMVSFVLALMFVAGLGYCLYRLQDVLFSEYPWESVAVWGPVSIFAAVITLGVLIVLLFIYFILSSLFTKTDEKSLFMLATLSIASGFGNALIIFVVNLALGAMTPDPDRYEFPTSIFLYFIVGLVIYVFGQQLIRSRLILIANHYVYNKRMELIQKILKMDYKNMEQIEDGKIQAGLNNDPETVSNFANIFITGIIALVTLIACFIYLGFINIYGLLVSVVVIVSLAAVYYFVGEVANTTWERTRDIQNVFFRFINDILHGFKELSLSQVRRSEFSSDMQQSCLNYRDKRIFADIKFSNAFIVGELLFTLVIGAVAFAFPLLFKNIEQSTLTNYIFVFLYMTGPVRTILGSIPSIFQMRVSYNRLNQLAEELSSTEQQDYRMIEAPKIDDKICLELRGVEFEYKSEEGNPFKVGPFDLKFNSYETTFITGGNGSGKSTLAKLITGLYKPDAGEVVLNGQKIDSESLKEKYSAIFSDFYLFEKLYGVEYQQKMDEIDKHLELLHIRDKVQIQDGAFSSTRLSTGQRKRMALLITYLEDKPIVLFDEWAADQDPEFRRYFYVQLLPELKRKGKCIIAITHDDRYFDMADKVIKLEMGKVVKQEVHERTDEEPMTNDVAFEKLNVPEAI